MCRPTSETADRMMTVFMRTRQLMTAEAVNRAAILSLAALVTAEPTWKPAPRYGVTPVCLGFQGGCLL